MSASAYAVQHLEFGYLLGKQPVPALRDVNLEVEKGEFLCLSGPSGSGKTTLLNVLGLIERVRPSMVHFDGKDLGALSESECNHLRRHRIGFVFQQFHLMPTLTAAENVEFFLARQGLPRRERETRVASALQAVGLSELKDRRPAQLSGGQQQRVAVARALAKNPEVVIADEPTASLDQKTGREIMQIFADASRERGVTIVVASHDPMVHAFARRHVRLLDGQIQPC